MFKFVSLLLLSCCLLSASALNTVSRYSFAAVIVPELLAKHADENAIVSPTSVQTVLAMTAFGAVGETLQELSQVAHLGGFASKTAAAEDYQQFLESFTKVSPQRIIIANRIYVGSQFTAKPTFNEQIARYFGSSVESVNFKDNDRAAEIINSWVAGQTQNRIKTIVDPSVLSETTAVVLVNAIYFKSPWQSEFNLGKTRKRDFYLTAEQTIQVDTMLNEDAPVEFCHSEELDATAIKLPFWKSDLKFVIFLPNQKDGLHAMQLRLTLENFGRLNATCRPDVMEVYLPKFKIELSISLNETLQKLGMTKSFAKADFSDMLEPNNQTIYISNVLHKAFITVNEKGVEAGAATAVLGESRMGRTRHNPIFRVDRPFGFAIEDANAPHFIGHVVHPNY